MLPDGALGGYAVTESVGWVRGGVFDGVAAARNERHGADENSAVRVAHVVVGVGDVKVAVRFVYGRP